jgi:outer membrane protein OmpA-like peptidoglycan-associated protein
MRKSFTIILLASYTICFAQTLPKLKENALGLFEKGRYRQAFELLQMYQQQKGDDLDVLRALGISAYYANNLPMAKQFLMLVAETKKADPTVFLYLAKTLHAEYNFREAVKGYKAYLQRTKADDPNRKGIISDIKRCAAGLKISQQPELALVENLGENVNSLHDEFAPVLSPNFDEKVYFSAAREDSEGGMRNDEGLTDIKTGHYNSDIYSTVFEGNDWTFPEHLSNSLINTSRHEYLLDFTRNGRVMLFFRGLTQYSGTILVDTFKADSDVRSLPPPFQAPIVAKDGDNALGFFNDSVMIFASRRPGGYGGLDLYYSVFRDYMWTNPVNMGNKVNSPYDETTPYLAKDGRTLYFSSNSIQSMGGYDIFKSTFIDDSLSFSDPINLGRPINSAGDDTHFRLTPDGMRGYYCSNRRDGYGERDIYTAIFKAFQKEQTMKLPPTFYLVESFKNNTAGSAEISDAPKYEEVSSLYYDTDEDLLRGDNLRQLRNVVELLRRYPNLKVILTINGNLGEKHSFDLYFGMKRAEILAKFLIDNGLQNTNIILKSVGAAYPIARTELDGNINLAGEKMNRRIDILIRNVTTEPIKVSYDAPSVSQFMIDTRGDKWSKHGQGLSYKIQVVSTKRIFDNEILNKYADAHMEADGLSGVYHYTVGLFNDFSSAEKVRRDVFKEGIKDVQIIPYIDGIKVGLEEVKRFASRYADLNNYLAARKKP